MTFKNAFLHAGIFFLVASNCNAAPGTCAKVKKIAGTECSDLKVEFDLSACNEREAKPVEIKCKGDLATATSTTANHIYTADFEIVDSWGNKSFSPVGPVRQSGSLHLEKSKPVEKVAKTELKKKNEEAELPQKKIVVPANSPVEISGFFDAFYSFNFNRPGIVTQPAIGTPSANSSYRAYDSYHNSIALNLAELTIKKTNGEVSFLSDLDFGQQTEQNHIGSGSLTLVDPSTNISTTYENISKTDEVSKHIGQAYLTYTPTWGRGLVLSVGKMYTHLGYEVAKAKDNWQYSRSYTYWYGMPVWHLGVAAVYPVSEKFSAGLYLYNGWNNLYDNNSGKTYGVQLKFTPNSNWTAIYNMITGPERTKQNSDWKTVNELNISYVASEKLSWAAEGLVGCEAGVTSDKEAAKWFGTSLHAKYQPAPFYWLSPRFEYYRDHNGYTLATSRAENILSTTLTNAFPVGSGLEFRAEGRLDYSNNSKLYTTDDAGASRYQFTGTLGVLFAF